MKSTLLLTAILFLVSAAGAQTTVIQPASPGTLAAEKELRDFYDAYADDLIKGRGEAIANRYDPRGYYSVGNGNKQLVTLEEAKTRYTTRWTAPKGFQWKDVNFEILSPDSATVVGQFDFESRSGDKGTFSYSAVLIRSGGKWRIRVEDESFNSTGYTTKTVSGNRNTPGIYKYTLTAESGASVSAHKHTADMKITVKSGRKFILMGDLNTAKVQTFEAGSTFVIPANTWHVEWWETPTVEEIEMIAPTMTIRAIPSSPRTN
jgi:quercetin dioxygenase-like cupin family protein